MVNEEQRKGLLTNQNWYTSSTVNDIATVTDADENTVVTNEYHQSATKTSRQHHDRSSSDLKALATASGNKCGGKKEKKFGTEIKGSQYSLKNVYKNKIELKPITISVRKHSK